MTENPIIFDRLLQRRRRSRAAASPANFLLDHVAGEFADRLGVVLRRFDVGVDLGKILADGGLHEGREPDARKIGVVALHRARILLWEIGARLALRASLSFCAVKSQVKCGNWEGRSNGRTWSRNFAASCPELRRPCAPPA